MIPAIVAAIVGLAVGAFVAFVGMRGARIDPDELSRPKPLAEDPLRPRTRAELDALVAGQSEPLWPVGADGYCTRCGITKEECPNCGDPFGWCRRCNPEGICHLDKDRYRSLRPLTRAEALDLARRMDLPDPRPRKPWETPTLTAIPRWAARALIFSRRMDP